MALLRDEKASVEAAIARILDERVEPLDPRLGEPIRYALEGGGKRLRPILCVTAYRALRKAPVPAPVYEAACAIEIIHTYSLMHDDLPCMDDDDLRRGRATVHRTYGERTAALAGAALIPLATAVLTDAGERLGFSPADRKALVSELTAAAGAAGMVGGQILDLEAEGRTIEAEGLEEIHRRKTGALFAAALRLGGRLAVVGAGVIAALGEAGTALGLAFQITDDVLDVTSDAAVLGKAAGRDRERGKATFASTLGVEHARWRAEEAVATAIAALREAGITDAALEALIRLAADREH
ncbi:MAG: polyprenyl synthetase family protein [Longimicrobiales bacterium]